MFGKRGVSDMDVQHNNGGTNHLKYPLQVRNGGNIFFFELKTSILCLLKITIHLLRK
jgi:hypothetical protein